MDTLRGSRYSLAAVQQILHRAAALQEMESLSRSQLLEMAAELNIAPEVVDQAEALWQQQQAEQQAADQARARRHRQLRQALIPYVAVNSFLIVLNIATVGTVTWAVYPLLGWGLGLVLGGYKSPGMRPCASIQSDG